MMRRRLFVSSFSRCLAFRLRSGGDVALHAAAQQLNCKNQHCFRSQLRLVRNREIDLGTILSGQLAEVFVNPADHSQDVLLREVDGALVIHLVGDRVQLILEVEAHAKREDSVVRLFYGKTLFWGFFTKRPRI